MSIRGLVCACGLLVASSLVLAATASAHERGADWSLAKVMRNVDDTRIRVGSRVVRVDSDTTLCSGEGRWVRRRGVRSWRHFRCTFTTFVGLLPGRDLEFRVHPLAAQRHAVTNAHWIPILR